MVSRWWNSRTQGFLKDPQTHYDHPTLGPLISLISTFHKKKKKTFPKVYLLQIFLIFSNIDLDTKLFFPLLQLEPEMCVYLHNVYKQVRKDFFTLRSTNLSLLKRILLFITAAYLLSAMDRTADPCHDFFQYACGSWNRKHVIPEDRSSISTFEVMADQLQVVLKGVYLKLFGVTESILTLFLAFSRNFRRKSN